MKKLIFIAGVIYCQIAQADEICIDEAKYESLVESVEMLLEPTYQFDSHLSYVEGYIMGREFIDGNHHSEYLEVMDELVNSKISLLISSLPILNMEKSEFDNKYKNRIINLAVGVRTSLQELESSIGMGNVEVLINRLGYFDEYENYSNVR